MSLTPVSTPKSDKGLDMVDNDAKEEAVSILAILKEANDNVDATVAFLIDHGADINAQDKYGMTPLHHTTIRGNKKVLTKLLNKPGIIKEPRDFQDSTPLHLAATYNQPAVARILLKEGDNNPRALDSDLKTPLHEACQEGSLKVAEILLEEAKEKYGPSIVRNMTHDKDDDGATPLLLGVGKGGTNIVQLLLNYQANPNQRNKEMAFPIHVAARTGDLDTLKLLCQVSMKRKVSCDNHATSMILMLQNGAVKNCLNAINQTPLYLAAENNNISVMEYLLDK